VEYHRLKSAVKTEPGTGVTQVTQDSLSSQVTLGSATKAEKRALEEADEMEVEPAGPSDLMDTEGN
jgi:hypothetical protein